MSIIVQKALRQGTRRAVDGPDYGPLYALERKDKNRARQIMKELRPDPADPRREVQGCRRVEEFRRMHTNGTLDVHQFLAAERYLDTAEAAAGATAGRSEAVGRLPPWMQGHPSEWQVMASVSLGRARAAVGCEGRALVDLLVLANLSVRAIAQRRAENPHETKGRILGTLSLLAEHWGV